MPINTLVNAVKVWADRRFVTIGGVRSTVDAAVKKSAPDWNAPEGETGHIKNRPFYEEAGRLPVADVLDIEFVATKTTDYDGSTVYAADISDYFSTVARASMELSDSGQYGDAPRFYSFDGVEHRLLVSDYNDVGVMYSRGYGNAFIRSAAQADTGELMYLSTYSPGDYSNTMTIYVADEKPHVVSFYVKDNVVHKLDEKFLPALVGNHGEAKGAEVFNDKEANAATGEYSHSEGFDTEASGEISHAEGRESVASGRVSHAEGEHTEASGEYSHAEGFRTLASQHCSHAEGWQSVASGYYSHAEGMSTSALSDAQHVQGMYNVEDADGKYAHIVGNGTPGDGNSNAHTLDWNGNAWYAGTVEGTAMIVKSPNGTRYQITVSDSGAISATAM